MRHSANFGFLYMYDDFVLGDVSELFFKLLSHDKFPRKCSLFYTFIMHLTRKMFDCSRRVCIQALEAKSKKQIAKKGK